jgi:hypothetical protein
MLQLAQLYFCAINWNSAKLSRVILVDDRAKQQLIINYPLLNSCNLCSIPAIWQYPGKHKQKLEINKTS